MNAKTASGTRTIITSTTCNSILTTKRIWKPLNLKSFTAKFLLSILETQDLCLAKKQEHTGCMHLCIKPDSKVVMDGVQTIWKPGSKRKTHTNWLWETSMWLTPERNLDKAKSELSSPIAKLIDPQVFQEILTCSAILVVKLWTDPPS